MTTDYRAELQRLVKAYDDHGGKWPQDDVEALDQAADRARALLNKSEPEGLTDEELMAVTPMDYETYISIQQYSSDSDYFYNLKVTNAMNEDYYYTGTVSTLGDVMLCIKHHLKEHTTTETP